MKDKKEHLPIYGVGPIYGIVIIALTVAGCILSAMGKFDVFKYEMNRVAFLIIGIAIFAFGFIVWFRAAFTIDKYIKSNELCVDGIYSWVRNPCYSGIMLMCTGVVFTANNILLLILPVCYYLFMTILMKNTEEIWLKKLYGADYETYCREVNRCIPFTGDFRKIYETKISDVRWIIYDILGNIGWILYFICIALLFGKRPEYMSNSAVYTFAVFAIVPALIMSVGIAELISERFAKLDRVLSQKRLYRSFGMLLFGALCGFVISLVMVLLNLKIGFSLSAQKCTVGLLIASVLLAVFAALLFAGYKKQKQCG